MRQGDKRVIERQLPIVWLVNGKIRVLDNKLGAIDKALIVLYYTRAPIASKDIVSHIKYSNASVFRKKVLKPADSEMLLEFDEKSDLVHISPLGSERVEKLLAQRT
ncbi:MAG TPA: hypothetical protein VGN68_06485 [Sphingopyxis sp.]|jgi:hypothetical protein|uniref:hypothetical protein n=1 Tax=Sphingopyxis sp. TaxID=1908224 RepID=UPI002E114AB0|nr:hypothetical protein [Sphingopyxis sp.]